jgi:hypothetical protein
MKSPAEAGQSRKERSARSCKRPDKPTPSVSYRRTFSAAVRQPHEGESLQGEKGMGANRFFGLDAIEWSVTLASSALIAFATWLM